MNSWFSAAIVYDGIQIAELAFKEIDDEFVVCIIYKDGTYEPALDMMEDIMIEIGQIIG